MSTNFGMNRYRQSCTLAEIRFRPQFLSVTLTCAKPSEIIGLAIY
jgi:hypothetical protein